MRSKIAKTVTAALAILALAACSTSTVDDDLIPTPDEGEVVDEGTMPTPPAGEIDENRMPIPGE